MKRMFYLMAVAFISIVTACTDELGVESNTDVQQIESLGAQDAESGYNHLIQSFNTNATSRTVGQKYPDYYGGAYIDNNRLIVNIPKGVSSYSNFDNILSETSYKIKECEFSYNELEKIMSVIEEYKQKNPYSSVSQNFYSYSISDKDNRIKVYLEEYTEEQVRLFKNDVIDSPAIEFVESNGILVLCSSPIRVGAGISAASNDAIGSIGYRAKYVNAGVTKYGFVTCAHVIPSGDDVKYGQTIIAKSDSKRWKHSGSVDATFCEYKNGYTISNKINMTNDTLSRETAYAGQGTTIHKCGVRTSLTDGKVVESTVNYNNGTISLTNVTKIKFDIPEYGANAGDSGGIVFGMSNNVTFGILFAIEINKTTKLPTGVAWYIKAPVINSEFGIERY